MKSYKITIRGIVQGVGFRAFVKNIADVLDVEGYVKNEKDGTVLAIANLKDDNKDKFIKELRVGPPSSKVEKIDIDEIEFCMYESFDIRQ